MQHRAMAIVGATLLLLIFSAGTLLSDTSLGTGETPEEVIQQYFEALQRGEYLKLASLLHPDLITQYSELLSDPEFAQSLMIVFGTEDLLALKTGSDIERYALMMASILGQESELGTMMANAQYTILGVVYEGADVAHVVYRANASFERIAINSADLLTLRRYADSWRLSSSVETDMLSSTLSEMLAI